MVTSQYEIQFVVSETGQVQAEIKGLTEGFEALSSALTKLKKDQQKQVETLVGTAKYYKEAIARAEEIRDRTQKTSEAYKEATVEIDKLRAKRDELTNSIKQAQAPMEGTLAYYRAEIKALRQQQVDTAKSSQAWEKYERDINSVRANIEKLTGSMKMSAKPNQDMISNAGLAGATITELGRTISDSNYGIRGMANNLSQLSSLFITLVAKTEGGFVPALKMLGSQIWGPLGLILGFQFLVQQLEAYSMSQDKAADSTKRASDEVYANALVLQDYVTQLNGVNLSEEERVEVISRLIEEIPILKEEDFKYGNNLLNVRKIIDDYVVSQASRLEIDQLIAENSEVLANKRRAEVINNEKDLTKRAELARSLLKELGEDTSYLTSTLAESGNIIYKKTEKTNNQILDQFRKFTDKLGEETKPILDKVQILQSQIKFDEDDAEENATRVSTIYQDLADELALIGQERFKAQMIQAEQEFNENVAKIRKEEKEKVITAEEAQKAIALAVELRTEKEKQIEKERAEYLLDLTEKQKERELKEAEKAEREKEKGYKNELDRIDKEALKASNAAKKTALDGIKDKKLLQAEFNRIDQENIKTQIATIEASIAAGKIGAEIGMETIEKFRARLASLGLAAAETDTPKKEEDPQKELERKLRQVEEAFNFITDAAMAALDAEMSIEEARTANLNNNLRLRLKNEKLTAEQREAINAQIAKNEEDLQQKRDKLAEKQFKLQKAISIGQALITTYEMASRAYNAVLAGPEKFLGVSALALAKVAAGAATLFGLAQVRAISRQQFVPSAISAPSGGAGDVSAPSIQAPDFNVVGQSQTSQLAALVQGQLDRPVKTYVVASEVSTAQELERKRISAATI